MEQRIIAFCNQKGGTAKTTTAANVGYALSTHKKRVLMIDLDTQGNLGLSFGLTNTDKPSIREVLSRKSSLEDAVEEINPFLYIVQAHSKLCETALELIGVTARESRLKSALKSAVGFDYILIDCPPNIDLLTVNALAAAKEVIIPVEAEYFAAKGVALIQNSIQAAAEDINQDLKIAGFLVTKVNMQQNLHRDIVSAIKEEFDDLVFKTMIPKNVKISEAQPFGVTVIERSPGSKGAIAYTELVNEIINQEEN